jgi:DNA-binding NarL/FixJ family response regulator
MPTDTPGAIRILLADDHDFFREGMRGLLATVPGMQVVAEASSGEDAVAMATRLQPDVVLMDLKMGSMNGIEATRTIVATSPHVGVLVLTMFEDDDWVFAAMKAGARGYLLKGSNQEEIVRAIRAVGNGEAIFGPGVARRLMRYFDTPTPAPVSQAFPGLTERETEVLIMIAQGLTNQQIADRLFVSVKTVRNHVTNVLSKLQVADRAQAALRARDAGLGNLPRS